jgi:MFS family permease
VGPFLAIYLSSARGLSVELAGFIASLYFGGGMVAGLAGGVLADRLGRRAVLLISLFGGPPLMMALALSRSIVVIAILTPLVGAVYELYRPAVSAMVADIVEPGERTRAYGLLYWAVNVGAAVAPAAGGFLARTSYFWLFAVDAATTFVYGLIVWAAVRETRPESAASGPKRGLDVALRDGVFVAFCLLTFVTSLLYIQGWVTLSLDMIGKGFSEATFGLVIAMNGVAIIILQPLSARAVARYDRARVLAVAAGLVAVGLTMNAFVHSAFLYGVAVTIWTLGEIAAAPTGAALVADLAPADVRGRYQGLYTVAWTTAGMVGPTLGALVLGRSSSALWIGCGAIGLALLVGFLIFGRFLRARTNP